MKPLITVCAIALLTGCSSMLLGGASGAGQELGTDQRSAGQMAADDSLAAIIRSRFALDSGISQYDMGVGARNGEVTLRGTVGSFAIRDRAVEIARNTDGVRSVNNQIAVNTRQ